MDEGQIIKALELLCNEEPSNFDTRRLMESLKTEGEILSHEQAGTFMRSVKKSDSAKQDLVNNLMS